MSESATPPPSAMETVIEPPKGWIGIDWKELWRYRELFGFLVWRDIAVMYKQTLLGVGWAVLVPFTQMVIFSLIFGRLAGLDSNGLPGPLFYYAGLLPWTYFAAAMTQSSNSMVGNARLLTKVYFPRIIVPTSSCIVPLVNFVIASTIMGVMMVIYGVIPTAWALLLPLLVVIAFLTAMGVGLTFASLNVKYRDIKYTIPFFAQIWMYLSVIIPFSMYESLGSWKWLCGLNPMFGVIEGFRWCLFQAHEGFGRYAEQTIDGVDTMVMVAPVDPPWTLLAMGVPVAIAMCTFGVFYFRRTEKYYADIV